MIVGYVDLPTVRSRTTLMEVDLGHCGIRSWEGDGDVVEDDCALPT